MTYYFMYEISQWWNYPLLYIMIGLSIIYLLLTRKYKVGKIKFLIGMSLIYICFGSPLYGIGHLMFSAHMTQMAILCFFVPPLLLMGVPDRIISKRIKFLSKKPYSIILKRPMILMIIFSGLFAIYHIPFVFDNVMTNKWLYIGYHVLLVITGIGMWAPLISPLSKFLSEQQRKKYIRWSALIITPACLLLVLAVNPLYQTFYDPQTWQAALDACFGLEHIEQMKNSLGLLPTMIDQRIGGVMMLALHKLSFYLGK